MKSIDVSDSTTVEEMLNAASQEDILLYREGKPVALLTAFDADDLEWYVRENDPRFIESIARAREQVKAGQVVQHEDLKREIGAG